MDRPAPIYNNRASTGIANNMPLSVFFSWQSDTDQKDGRNFIEKALRAAVSKIRNDTDVEEAIREIEVDKDTQGVPGTPPLFDTILRKIDTAAVFVGDLTICGTRSGERPTPNPNVLIEYGYALRARGHSRIVNVMNAAYGDPKKIEMPFDLAHLRFPITYKLPPGADEAARKAVREELVKDLESALRVIFESHEFKATLPKPPAPALFTPKEAKNRKARFRQTGEPLGYVEPLAPMFAGNPTATPVYLAEGPASWFHLSPVHDPGRTWRVQELKQTALPLYLVPISRITGTVGGLRDEDGYGFYLPQPDSVKSIVYAFDTGEIWVIDAWMTSIEDFLELDEKAWVATLETCGAWMDKNGRPGPYQWNVGFEGVRGRRLITPTSFNRTFGVCLKETVEESGTYRIGDKAATALRPFFEKIWDACGAPRPQGLEAAGAS